MRTLILYDSKYGTTEKCAQHLAAQIKNDVDMQKIIPKKNYDLSDYQQIILGTPIYMGKPRKVFTEFLNNHQDSLLTKRLHLYICGMQEAAADEELKNAYPKKLSEHATHQAYFGGEFIFTKMNFFEKLIVKTVTKKGHPTVETPESNDICALRHEEMEVFTKNIILGK
ncbi:flavodoxin domain-containing protein [Listeria costaricensis]|uniref:flavodoxin domain-containing protein n=1 Tax=Listeria costaricensis TaxID=2026604 RepID=UPI0013C4F2A6|nr:flavodoxin domain-containing protein [Listeria costaricensis]